MEHVSTDDIDSRMGPADAKRPLSRALGATDVAINDYELAPGESFAFGYHAHEDQEEIFYVLAGTVTFETDDDPVEVGAGEAVRFAPGEFQRGVNEGETRVHALAIGAPQGAGETTIYRACGDCGERTEVDVEPTDDCDALVTVCQVCATETGRFR